MQTYNSNKYPDVVAGDHCTFETLPHLPGERFYSCIYVILMTVNDRFYGIVLTE